jgi:DNA replication and repair protein RecF
MVKVVRCRLRDFRSYAKEEVALGEGLTVVAGDNGAGKTNLLEALYFGCTGRSCRTSNEREVVRFGSGPARVEVETEDEAGAHVLAVGFTPGEPKRLRVDGASVEKLADSPARPLVAVFLPDRLELVKGTPQVRRAHLDQVVAALWPSRVVARRAYAQALAQRNALLGRIRAGAAGEATLDTWDRQLADRGIALMADRRETAERLRAPFAARADELGLTGEVDVAYRPRSKAQDVAGLLAELVERRAGDLERGFTQHGPHRDDLVLRREGHELRAYGSQGQQRLALLALLLAERETIGELRGHPPLLLLDDVMSELDLERRERLVAAITDGGQALITTTDLAHVPGVDGPEVRRLRVADGHVVPAGPEALAA